jgi:hypothetical protein
MEEFELKSELVAYLKDQPEGTQAFYRTSPIRCRQINLMSASNQSGYKVATRRIDDGFLITKGALVSSEVMGNYREVRASNKRSLRASGDYGSQGEHSAQIADLTEVGQTVTTTQSPVVLRKDAERHGFKITTKAVTLPDGSKAREVTRIT